VRWRRRRDESSTKDLEELTGRFVPTSVRGLAGENSTVASIHRI
jgi:hypothetical protein